MTDVWYAFSILLLVTPKQVPRRRHAAFKRDLRAYAKANNKLKIRLRLIALSWLKIYMNEEMSHSYCFVEILDFRSAISSASRGESAIRIYVHFADPVSKICPCSEPSRIPYHEDVHFIRRLHRFVWDSLCQCTISGSALRDNVRCLAFTSRAVIEYFPLLYQTAVSRQLHRLLLTSLFLFWATLWRLYSHLEVESDHSSLLATATAGGKRASA